MLLANCSTGSPYLVNGSRGELLGFCEVSHVRRELKAQESRLQKGALGGCAALQLQLVAWPNCQQGGN